jgi:hypothetical protein
VLRGWCSHDHRAPLASPRSTPGARARRALARRGARARHRWIRRVGAASRSARQPTSRASPSRHAAEPYRRGASRSGPPRRRPPPSPTADPR